MNSVHVLLVDDNESFRQSLVWLLENADMRVTEFESGAALLEKLDQIVDTQRIADPLASMPFCIVSDIRMPEMDGLALMTALQKRRCRLPMIMITGHGDVGMAVEVMQRGAATVIEKPFDEEVLIEAINTAVNDPAARLRSPEVARERLSLLSPRERQVMQLVCSGKVNKVIADVLGISVKTVEVHRASVLSKLGARNIQQLMRISMGYEL